MFGFLKKKLKDAVGSLTKKVEEEGKEEEVVQEVTEPVKKEKPKAAPKKNKESPIEEKKPAPKPEKKVEKKKEPEPEPPKKESVSEPPKKEVAPEPTKIPTPPPAEKKQEETEDIIIKEEPVVEKKEEVVTPPPEPVVEATPAVEEKKEEQPAEKKGFFKRLFKKEEEPVAEPESAVTPPEPKETVILPKKEESSEEKGLLKRFTQKIVTKQITNEQFNEMFWDLELALLENNVAVEVIEKLKHDLSSEIVDRPLKRGQIEETILTTLKHSLTTLFTAEPIDLIKTVKSKKDPYVICFVGINGTGKTTTIAKMTKLLQDAGLSVVMAACDTFRAAAIDQLQTHADKLDVKLIKHDYGADPAAVAFDAIAHAKKAGKDVVLIDTAGRLHSNTNLMEELHKIIRIAKPDMKIFIGESVTGNDCVLQAKKFDETVGIDGIVLSKADVDEKGGAAISVSYVTGKPILFLGTGQTYDDLEAFDSQKLLAKLGI